MTEANPRTLPANRKRRGVAKASITRIQTRLSELERSPRESSTLDLARSLATRLQTLDQEYKVHHYAIIDLLDEEEDLQREQETLDGHDDDVAQLSVRIQKLIDTSSSSNSDQHKVASKRLRHLEKGISSTRDAITVLRPDDSNVCLLHQHEERLAEFKKELCDIRRGLLSLDLDDTSELSMLQATVDKGIFDCSQEIRKLLQAQAPSSSTSESNGVKLPKLNVPTFDGNILSWTTFWEQFNISVHSPSNLSDSEKLMYLWHALKSGTAKGIMEGLSKSGEHYKEAVSCLKS